MRTASRRNSDMSDRGFTLIELSVIVMIIAVLVMVAIVTLVGAQKRAHDTAAKSRVVTAMKTQKVWYTDQDGYTADATALETMEPTVDFESWSGVGAVVKGQVFIREADGDVVTMVSRSNDECFWTHEAHGVIGYARNDCSAEPTAWEKSW